MKMKHIFTTKRWAVSALFCGVDCSRILIFCWINLPPGCARARGRCGVCVALPPHSGVSTLLPGNLCEYSHERANPSRPVAGSSEQRPPCRAPPPGSPPSPSTRSASHRHHTALRPTRDCAGAGAGPLPSAGERAGLHRPRGGPRPQSVRQDLAAPPQPARPPGQAGDPRPASNSAGV